MHQFGFIFKRNMYYSTMNIMDETSYYINMEVLKVVIYVL